MVVHYGLYARCIEQHAEVYAQYDVSALPSFSHPAFCLHQDSEQQTLHDALNQLNSSRIAMNKAAMLTLGSWALGNILINGLLMFRSEGEAFAFQQMNTLWNVVNLGLAGLGYWGALAETEAVMSTYTLAQTVEKQHTLESILLFNAGLDVAYMAGGAWMLDHARDYNKQRSVARLGAQLASARSVFAFVRCNSLLVAAQRASVNDKFPA
jgi:hypothetical protein